MRAPFHFETAEQLRAFRLLTLAQLVFLETQGLGIGTPPSAKNAALAALDLGHMHGAASMSANDLIAALRKAATEAIGHSPAYTQAPTKPIQPDGYEATT